MTFQDQSLGQLARRIPGATRIFHDYALDFCCGGKQTLRDAALEKGLDAAAIDSIEARLHALHDDAAPAGQDWNTATPAALIRAIVDTDPPRVSDVVTTSTDPASQLTTDAARYGTTAAKLRRALRGDLDTIVAKALKKDPAERYASVTAMADDLHGTGGTGNREGHHNEGKQAQIHEGTRREGTWRRTD